MTPRPGSLSGGVALLLCLLLSAGGASAQDTEPAPEPAPAEPKAFALSEVAAQAENTGGVLREIAAAAAASTEIEEIGRDLPDYTAAVRRQADETLGEVSGAVSLDALADLENDWSLRSETLESASRTLGRRVAKLDELLLQLDRLEQRWAKTRETARAEGAPDVLVEQTGAQLSAIERTRRAVRTRRAEVLELQQRVAEPKAVVDDLLADLARARRERREQLLVADFPPAWRMFGAEGVRGEGLEGIRASWQAGVASLRTFPREREARLLLHGLLFVAVLLVVLPLRRRAVVWAREDPDCEPPARLLSRPVSAALLVTILAAPSIYPRPPAFVRDVVGILLLVPVLRLLPGAVIRAMRPVLVALAGFYVLDRARSLMGGAVVVERLLLIVESFGVVATLAWLLRPARLVNLPRGSAWMRGIGIALRAAAAVALVSLFANLLGYVALSRLLVQATLSSAWAAVLLFAAARVIDGIVILGLRTAALRRLRVVTRHGYLLRRRLFTAVHLGMAAAWTAFVLERFSIRRDVFAAVGAALGTEASFGTVTISAGDVLAFVLTVVVAIYSSRVLRFVLDEDVLPRLPLPRGVPYAISYAVHYAILLLGFFLAVAAAGIDLGKFTLLAGALGVGIGFGLQNVVNNFVSGLILLFERPIQVGDTVETGGLFGEVKRIGMRSSTVRTWQGAEVIVPNANLISERVVNWTLSDRQRRIEVPVGVKYGTDPEQVLELLRGVGRAHPDILDTPEPVALFLAFGDSSLGFELRAWTASDRFLGIKSELIVAIHRALAEAGIEIPFPQRDLHVRSIDPKLALGAPAPARGGTEGESDA